MSEQEPKINCIVKCSNCHMNNGSKRCSNCKIVHYCSVECQKADWINHKQACIHLDKNSRLKSILDELKNNLQLNGFIGAMIQYKITKGWVPKIVQVLITKIDPITITISEEIDIDIRNLEFQENSVAIVYASTIHVATTLNSICCVLYLPLEFCEHVYKIIQKSGTTFPDSPWPVTLTISGNEIFVKV